LLGIYDGQTLVQNFNVALPDDESAHWLAAYPLRQFGLGGKEIRIAPVDGKQLSESSRAGFDRIKVGNEADALASDDYAQPYRNQFHVSTRRGWNNDPNGMVYHDGKYHLYYQYNPFGISWGNMHWGHFESTDLIHWEEKPIVLFQKTTQDMAFSGGGFVDTGNSAGLGENTLFVAFTSTGRGECLAYSKDGGMTFTELEENPVVEHNGRDPKIVWYEPEQKWVMVVYDNSECAETKAIPAAEGAEKRAMANIAFYESKNLRQWTRTGAFTDPDRNAVYECPEFFELPIEGRAGESRWILLGAQNRYFVGTFNGKTFTKESGPHGTAHGIFYAAQTFSDVPDGRRIQIGWVRTGSYQQKFPDQIVSQSFTLPHQMTLRETPDGLRVLFSPVKETEQLRSEILAQGKDLSAEAANELLQKCRGELSEVVIEFAEGGAKELTINGIDARCDAASVRDFTDLTFNEIYADGGRSYEVRKRTPPKFESTETRLKAKPDTRIKSLTIYRLKSIWTAGEQKEEL
jgi:fructan beta-fructosidase